MRKMSRKLLVAEESLDCMNTTRSEFKFMSAKDHFSYVRFPIISANDSHLFQMVPIVALQLIRVFFICFIIFISLYFFSKGIFVCSVCHVRIAVLIVCLLRTFG